MHVQWLFLAKKGKKQTVRKAKESERETIRAENG
jgi:hypothetical protein